MYCVLTRYCHGHAHSLSDGQVRRGGVMAVLGAHLGDVTHHDTQFLAVRLVILQHVITRSHDATTRHHTIA